MISCFEKHNCVYRSIKKYTIEIIVDKSTPFGNSHTVILKMQRRVNIKIQNLTIMVITVMK